MPVAITDNQMQTEPVIRKANDPPLFRPWLWFALGSILLLFSYGIHNIPIAAWLAPVFLLYFVHGQRWRVWIPVVYLVQAVAIAFQFRGMSLESGVDYYLFLAIAALQALLPYAADRWLAARIDGIASTLVFPCVWTMLDYLNSFGPWGSWGAAAYSQSGDLPLLQLVSVTGLWGLTFLIAWFAAVCAHLWQEGWISRGARTATYLCFGVLAAVMFLGGLRLTLFPPSSPTVRIASLSARDLATKPNPDFWDRLIRNQATAGDLASFRHWATAIDNDLLVRAEREAKSGASVVFWAEGNANVLKADESAFLERGSVLAGANDIYLGMALATWNPGEAKILENKFVLIQPDGQMAWRYYKSHPVPGGEAAMSVTKGDRLKTLETPFGRLSSVICFDGDFPQLLAQAGTLGSDIVLDPSNDWRAIDPWHTEMASFRAIEQGTNFDRQTSHGLSAAFDYEGRVLARMDHFRSTDFAMIADVPIKGVRTIYSRLGDWFAWFNMAVVLMLIVAALRRRARPIHRAPYTSIPP